MKMGGRGVFLSFGAVALLAGGALLVSSARRGWIPHDEGLLAQSAERVLAGELPHRDFDAAYTGGLELLHAAAFRLLGEDLSSLRWTLLAFALAFVCALYVLASRIAAPPLAAALSIAGVAWSLPNYFAALPSWYVLFLWTFGGVFLSAYARRRRAGWLVAAGACAGLAFLAKTPGILLLAAAFLFLVFDDQALAAREPPAQPSRSLLWPLAGALVLFLAGLLALVARQLGPMEVLLYLVPSAALSGLLLRQEARLAGGAPRARRLLARGLALAAGAAVPIALFLVPYALSGSLDDFWRGTFVLPQRRFDHASFPLPPVWTAAAALPLAIPLALPSAFGRLRPWILGGAAIALGGVLLALAGREPVYRAIWYAVRPLTPFAVVLGCVTLSRRPLPELAEARDGFLLLGLASLVGLLQYPYAFSVYFCYTAPLVLLATAWTVRERGRAPLAWLYVPTLAFFAAFALLWLNTGWVRTIGGTWVASPPSRPLELPRAGIEVPLYDGAVYEALVAEIDRHAAPGEFIYAAPDCPEVYFLSGRRNPTRTFYDVFDEDAAQPALREGRLLRTLSERGVRVVVLSASPEFSPRVAPGLVEELARRYPMMRTVGHFLVMWRT